MVSQVILNLLHLNLQLLYIELLVIKKRDSNKSKEKWIIGCPCMVHGLATGGTLQKLTMRIMKFKLYHSLTMKLKVKSEKIIFWYQFVSS